MTGADPLVLGVDVGTQSARAGVFDLTGTLLGRGEHAVQTWRPEPDHVEQSTRDIWGAVCTATRQAIDDPVGRVFAHGGRHVADTIWPVIRRIGLRLDYRRRCRRSDGSDGRRKAVVLHSESRTMA